MVLIIVLVLYSVSVREVLNVIKERLKLVVIVVNLVIEIEFFVIFVM